VEPDGGPVTVCHSFSFVPFVFFLFCSDSEVHEIDRELLPMIFCQSPALAGRFYHYLAKISSSLLRDIKAELAM
jgi:hypothetical protein